MDVFDAPLTVGILIAAVAVLLVVALLVVCILIVFVASKPRHDDDERDR